MLIIKIINLPNISPPSDGRGLREGENTERFVPRFSIEGLTSKSSPHPEADTASRGRKK
jgi:hypothetical protein